MNFSFAYNIAGNTVANTDVKMEYFIKGIVKQVILTMPRSHLNTYSISNGSAVLIQYGVTSTTDLGYAFRGTVESVIDAGSSVKLVCNDKLFQLANRTINNIYYSNDAFSGVISDIGIDMITTYGGLDADGTTVEATGSLTINDQLWCFDSNVKEKALQLFQAVRYVMYYDDSDDKVYAHSKGYRSCADSFTYNASGSGGNISTIPVWVDDTTNLFNYLKLTGANRTTYTTETFNGDASTLNFTLTNVPADKTDVQVNETVDGLQTYGIPGVTASYDYTIDDNPSVKQIQYVAGNPPPVGVDNVIVDYSYNVKLFSEFIDEASKIAYPSVDGGFREESLFNPDIKTVDDLERIGNALIQNFSNPFTSVKFTATSLSEIPQYGMNVTITDNYHNRSGTYILKSFSFSTTSAGFKFEIEEAIGDPTELLYTSNDRLRKLEESSRGNQTAITDSRVITPIMEVNTYFELTSFDAWTDTWNTSENWDSAGTWGSSPVSDDFSVDLTSTNWDETGTWSVASDIYSVDASGGRSIWDYNGYTDWLNPIINVKIRPITDETVGILFRFDGTDGYCIRYKDANKVEFGTYNTSTGFSQIKETSYARALNVWTYWKIVVFGNNIIFQAADERKNLDAIFNTTDDTISSSGSVGLIAFSTDADFDDFEVGTVEAIQVEA